MQGRLKDKVKKLQTYKMFDGDDTVYVERNDVLNLIDEYKLTIGELRKEVSQSGYMVVKRNYTKLLPCLCGCNKRRRLEKNGLLYIECKQCERYSTGKNVYQVVENWNTMMTKPKKQLGEEHKQHLSESAKAYWDKKRKEENAQNEV